MPVFPVWPRLIMLCGECQMPPELRKIYEILVLCQQFSEPGISRLMFLAFFSEDQSQRNLVEAAFFADAIGQITFVGEVNTFGRRDEKDKRGRLDAGLCYVRNAHGSVTVAPHRVFQKCLFDQRVEW